MGIEMEAEMAGESPIRIGNKCKETTRNTYETMEDSFIIVSQCSFRDALNLVVRSEPSKSLPRYCQEKLSVNIS